MRFYSIVTTALLATTGLCGFAQERSLPTTPFYLPGDGMYLVGMPHNLYPAVSEPTIITQAYRSMPIISGVDLVSIKAGTKTYNLSDRISEEGDILDMRSFMGIGTAYNLTVRNFEGDHYSLGDHAPHKTWYNTRILAAHPAWLGRHTYPLAVYDQWDCPITYDADPRLTSREWSSLKVNFGNPHEGLVVSHINGNVVNAADADPSQTFDVAIDVWDDDRTDILFSYVTTLTLGTLPVVRTLDDGTEIRSILIPISHDDASPLVIHTPFDVSIEGLDALDGKMWFPRTIDHTGLYPTHTTYYDAHQMTLRDDDSDVCINVEGYFNYIGTWGWWQGKSERGEVVSSPDLVQIYYDPADADWPGDYFMGEAAFPLETTFGSSDIMVYSKPDWINSITYDNSQWEEYGCTQISLSADGLPEEMSGRNGYVVLGTADGASYYTIYLRQGMADFDFDATTSIATPQLAAPRSAATGLYDLHGRAVTTPQKGQTYVKDGHLCIEF